MGEVDGKLRQIAEESALKLPSANKRKNKQRKQGLAQTISKISKKARTQSGLDQKTILEVER